jgi:hypothetical protein
LLCKVGEIGVEIETNRTSAPPANFKRVQHDDLSPSNNVQSLRSNFGLWTFRVYGFGEFTDSDVKNKNSQGLCVVSRFPKTPMG